MIFIKTQKTLKGHKGGYYIKKAHVGRSKAGLWEVFIDDRIALMNTDCNLVMESFDSKKVCLELNTKCQGLLCQLIDKRDELNSLEEGT